MTKKIIVYSTKSCPWCVKAKEFLKENNVKFEEKDVGEDEKARDEMLEKSGQMGVPVIEIQEEEKEPVMIVGFDQEALKKALGL